MRRRPQACVLAVCTCFRTYVKSRKKTPDALAVSARPRRLQASADRLFFPPFPSFLNSRLCSFYMTIRRTDHRFHTLLFSQTRTLALLPEREHSDLTICHISPTTIPSLKIGQQCDFGTLKSTILRAWVSIACIWICAKASFS